MKLRLTFIMFVMFVAVLMTASVCYAGPWLAATPADPIYQITHVRVTLDGVVLPDIPYELGLNTGLVIIYDLGTLDDGAHEFNEIRFVNVRGPSDPVPFLLPALPMSLEGLVVSADR